MAKSWDRATLQVEIQPLPCPLRVTTHVTSTAGCHESEIWSQHSQDQACCHKDHPLVASASPPGPSYHSHQGKAAPRRSSAWSCCYLSFVLICRALANILAPVSPMALPLMSSAVRLVLLPRALSRTLVPSLRRDSATDRDWRGWVGEEEGETWPSPSPGRPAEPQPRGGDTWVALEMEAARWLRSGQRWDVWGWMGTGDTHTIVLLGELDDAVQDVQQPVPAGEAGGYARAQGARRQGGLPAWGQGAATRTHLDLMLKFFPSETCRMDLLLPMDSTSVTMSESKPARDEHAAMLPALRSTEVAPWSPQGPSQSHHVGQQKGLWSSPWLSSHKHI